MTAMGLKGGMLKARVRYLKYFVDVKKYIFIIVNDDTILYFWVIPT